LVLWVEFLGLLAAGLRLGGCWFGRVLGVVFGVID